MRTEAALARHQRGVELPCCVAAADDAASAPVAVPSSASGPRVQRICQQRGALVGHCGPRQALYLTGRLGGERVEGGGGVGGLGAGRCCSCMPCGWCSVAWRVGGLCVWRRPRRGDSAGAIGQVDRAALLQRFEEAAPVRGVAQRSQLGEQASRAQERPCSVRREGPPSGKRDRSEQLLACARWCWPLAVTVSEGRSVGVGERLAEAHNGRRVVRARLQHAQLRVGRGVNGKRGHGRGREGRCCARSGAPREVAAEAAGHGVTV